MPDNPADTVTVGVRLVMKFLIVQTPKHLFDVIGAAQEKVQNELLPCHRFS
jgi:hypothetical protein